MNNYLEDQAIQTNSIVNEHVIIPFKMEITPIKKLILVNFDKNPEEIYSGLELQYLVTKNEGSGYRLIAYRNDKYVDVYDEDSLMIKDIGSFEVCLNGLANYCKVSFSKANFEIIKEGLQVEFALTDYKGRKIDVTIKEHSKKKSRAFDLIAPIGVSSINPVVLPVFAMYQFDLVRKRNTEISIQIDNKSIIPDPFLVPFPKDGQFRYFTRYGYDCELIDFGRERKEILPFHEMNNSNIIKHDGLISSFQYDKGTYKLKSMAFEKSDHQFKLHFTEAFPDIVKMDNKTVKGSFRMEMDTSMGDISGEYCITKKESIVQIELIPSKGWTVTNKMLLTKIMLGKKSIFRNWPKTYCYKQIINIDTKESTCSWQRINFEPKENYF